SSLKVTSINDTKFRSFRKKFKKITLRDLANKIEEKVRKSTQVSTNRAERAKLYRKPAKGNN
ncbi:hypothetical protein, partial [Vibrio sp. D409a]